MLESAPISAIALTDSSLHLQPPQPPTETKRLLLAALLSAVLPGAGQFLLGQRRKASILLLILVFLIAGFWSLRFLRFYAGFASLYCSWIALYIYAACSAQQTRSQTSSRPSKLWLVATLPLTFLTLSVSGVAVTRAAGFHSFTVPSPSMEKTVLEGDRIVADMRYYRSRAPGPQDVIVFKREGTYFIKRVIAVGGDTIRSKGGAGVCQWANDH